MTTQHSFKIYFAPIHETTKPPRKLPLYRDYALTYNVFMEAFMNEVKVMESSGGGGFVMQCRLPNAELFAQFETLRAKDGEVRILFTTNKKAFDAYWRKDDADLIASLSLK